MKSMDRGHDLIVSDEFSAADGAALCSVEQVCLLHFCSVPFLD
jgi:hypothetical protein